MKRKLINCTICGYLLLLSYGIVAHTLSLGASSHVGMYYVVWDMFCGWSGYEVRNHYIAEGQSGQFYRLTPRPWGDFQPFGPASRQDYDGYNHHSGTIIRNILAHTDHEPIERVYLVEENWAKKYNMPETLWNYQFEEPKQPRHYFSVRGTYQENGQAIAINSPWISQMNYQFTMSNPKLRKLSVQSRPYMQVIPTHDKPMSTAASTNTQINTSR